MIIAINHARMSPTAIQIAGKPALASVTSSFSGGLVRECRRAASTDFPLP